MPAIELSKISRHRAELMGFAIIIVMLFHVDLPRHATLFGLRRMGNLGVDIFLFLSGIGLWYSWSKQQDWKRFYLHRALRIYPAWLIIAGYFYVSRFHGGDIMAYIDLIGDIAVNWDFWLHDELTFWYVPATMMLYIFAPPYMDMIRRHDVFRWLVTIPLMWCIIMQYVAPVHDAVGHIEIFWSRVPIFFLGINIAESIRQKQRIDGTAWWMILIVFAISLSACIWLEQNIHGHFPLYTERMLYIPLSITTIIIVSEVFSHTHAYVNKFFAFIGGISLEIYLIHQEYILKPLMQYHLGYWPTFFITFTLSIPAAWIVSKICNRIINIVH